MNNEVIVSNPEEREKLITVLQNSLYAGAKRESVELVLGYCAAKNLDPMLKPVHIVPMSVKNAQTNEYEWRDVIMPGVGSYRIQADRSGLLAGITEPEFGPDVTKTFIDKNNRQIEVTYPEWCKITVKKIVADRIVEFTAREEWIENYATEKKNVEAPNSMWKKRPRGQLAKCAEAQALRKAFPDVGQDPTSEEMEGKTFDVNEEPGANPQPPSQEPTVNYYPDDKFKENFPKWEKLILSGKKTIEQVIKTVKAKGNMSEEQISKIKAVGNKANNNQ